MPLLKPQEPPVVTPDEDAPGKIGTEVEIGAKEEGKEEASIEVEVVDARPPADRREPLKDQDKVGEDKEIDKELEGLKTQGAKRIQELKHQVHDQRRLKETAEREREAAVRYAAAMRDRYTDVQRRSGEIEKAAYAAAEGRAKAELETAKRDHKVAYEAADADKIADATARIARAAGDEQRFAYAQPMQPEPPPQPDPRSVIPDQRALDWARRNSWFAMRNGAPANPESAVAYSIHVALMQQGIDPGGEATADKYYQELDRRLHAVYPEKFAKPEDEDTPTEAETPPKGRADNGARRPQAIVAPANRGGPAPKKVTLTQDQVAIAKRLGVSLEDYARHALMLERNE